MFYLILKSCFIDCHGDKENIHTYFRSIRFNDKEQFKKKSNCVITAQYGILSFLPLFTIEQLIKFTNQYFLFISILQVSTHVTNTQYINYKYLRIVGT